jgi:hypothetical protein
MERSAIRGTVAACNTAPDYAALHPGYGFLSGREIRNDRIEYGKTVLRHAQPAVGVDDDGAFLAQDGDPARIERASGQRCIAPGALRC